MSVLASNGHISDALVVYDEIKNNKGSLEPKAALSIIVSWLIVHYIFVSI